MANASCQLIRAAVELSSELEARLQCCCHVPRTSRAIASSRRQQETSTVEHKRVRDRSGLLGSSTELWIPLFRAKIVRIGLPGPTFSSPAARFKELRLGDRARQPEIGYPGRHHHPRQPLHRSRDPGGAVRGFPVLRAEKCLHASSHDLCGSCRRPALAYSTGSQLVLASRAAAFSAMQQQRYELGPSRMQ